MCNCFIDAALRPRISKTSMCSHHYITFPLAYYITINLPVPSVFTATFVTHGTSKTPQLPDIEIFCFPLDFHNFANGPKNMLCSYRHPRILNMHSNRMYI